ncbi:MAG: hypothetical protein NDJ92_19775, partial [Thermoanaerobaculia bacterium]|nr:hypothetical protein [Thermoanaerobaculia bacterium]
GIEASVFLTLAELGAISFIAWRIRVRGPMAAAIPATPDAVLLTYLPEGEPEDVKVADVAPPSSKETES